MWISRVTGLAFLCAALPVWGQDTPPGGAAPPPTPVVLENSGKPMLLPFQCTDEDIHSAGLSCAEDEPCAVFLELSAAFSLGSRILTAGNLHTEAATLYSVLLASDDGGHSWTEAHDRIRSAGLDRVQVQPPDKAWISGEELSPIPRNPFLLTTTDGGKTWRNRPILNDASENRFGVVQQFFFDPKGDGSLLVDRGRGAEGRYVLYESSDGGDTWLLKQESEKPISAKSAPARPADWRVRVDPATKSFHIERRQGERWSSVGAFLVRLDPCKPPKPQ